jgi:UDP-glucose 4-epimerase
VSNIFVTGMSGYLGTRLIRRFRKRSDIGDIAGIDLKPPSTKDAASETAAFYPTDIRDPAVADLMNRHKADTLFHLAFVVQPIRDHQKMHDIDINGTKNVLEAARNAGVRHVIAVSSTLAYGAHPDNPEKLTEDMPLRGNKTFPYGHFKAVTDQMIQDFAAQNPDMTVTILRPCTVFGPHIDNYVSRMLFLPVTFCVKGYDPPVQFLHEDDFVDACEVAMEKRLPGAFNITGNGTLTITRIAEILGTRVLPVQAWLLYPALESLWRMHFPRIEVNRGYLDYIRYPFVADNRKAKTALGFTPRYTSQQALKQMIKSRQQ